MSKQVFVIFTGGTICCASMQGYGNIQGENPYLLLDLYQKNALADIHIHTKEPYRTLSENLSGSHLPLLARAVQECLDQQADAILVTHGTDSLQYSSAFLSYLFATVDIPIVLVSSNYPLLEPKSNGLANFRYALRFVSEAAAAGVFVSYQNENQPPTIHRGSRLLAHQAYEDAVYSVGGQFYGCFGAAGFQKNPAYQALPDQLPPFSVETPLAEQSSAILRIEPYPGLCYPADLRGIRAVLHGGYHTGGIRSEGQPFEDFLARCRSAEIPIYLSGAEYGYTYASNPSLFETGLRMLPKAAPITMYMKLWLALCSGQDPDQVLFRSLAEDLLPPYPSPANAAFWQTARC